MLQLTSALGSQSKSKFDSGSVAKAVCVPVRARSSRVACPDAISSCASLRNLYGKAGFHVGALDGPIPLPSNNLGCETLHLRHQKDLTSSQRQMKPRRRKADGHQQPSDQAQRSASAQLSGLSAGSATSVAFSMTHTKQGTVQRAFGASRTLYFESSDV